MATSERGAQRLWHAWILASRPRTLPATLAPVIVGTSLAIADGTFEPLVALATLLSALLIQVGANFANDLGDFRKGADPETRTGPTRVTSAGLLSPSAVEKGMWVVFGLAALIGLYLVYVGGWPILVVGAAAIVSAIAYTAGPYPLGYHGLGDFFVFVFFGLAAVMGTYYVQAGVVTLASLVAAIPLGALVTAILVVNNVRDVETDRVAGKRTLAVLLGRNGARVEYFALLFVAYLAPLVLWLGLGFSFWVWLPLISLPLAVRLARTVATQIGPVLNRALAGTAQLAAIYGLLLSLGIVIG